MKQMESLKREQEVESTRIWEILEHKRQEEDEKIMIEDDKRQINERFDAKDEEIMTWN